MPLLRQAALTLGLALASQPASAQSARAGVDTVRLTDCQASLLPAAPWWNSTRAVDQRWSRGTILPLDTAVAALRLRFLRQPPDSAGRQMLLAMQNCAFKNAMRARDVAWLLRARAYSDLTLEYAPSDMASLLAYMVGVHLAAQATSRAQQTGSCADASLGLEGAAYALRWRLGPRPGHPSLGMHGLVDSAQARVRALCPAY